ncbi:hypothetical protein BpHYR1_041158 [Brachionus plicatilis]|uniref:Uncharacterized protein n=1 Tax=Brachionus plicatilis TaxID=10195 RepID=A0A3M7P2B6_BRAPC|nr:hypothetical protein BpHYR1_041158 [Brachionus plicatilis]
MTEEEMLKCPKELFNIKKFNPLEDRIKFIQNLILTQKLNTKIVEFKKLKKSLFESLVLIISTQSKRPIVKTHKGMIEPIY